ncbi:MAG: hypothetical protein HKN84_12970, partial [Gammaproteobacteria bacterium]|nr:hypothetical protein [Gammaproteobacteria bacterium]
MTTIFSITVFGMIGGCKVVDVDGTGQLGDDNFESVTRATNSATGKTGSVTLSWLPPVQYTDGQPLDIGGYRVYAGPSWSNLSLVEDLPQPGISSYMLSGLSAGKWFFALTVYDLQ